jgi:dihydrofolate reductase
MVKNLSIIVAIDENFGIGNNNQLLCHVPGDLKRFKEITTGNTVIMGRKTWESLPKKPLPNRNNIVLTRNTTYEAEGATVLHSVEEIMNSFNAEGENFVIGGSEVYKLFLPYSNKLYITHIHKQFEADSWFPNISLKSYKINERSGLIKNPDCDFSFEYITYIR